VARPLASFALNGRLAAGHVQIGSKCSSLHKSAPPPCGTGRSRPTLQARPLQIAAKLRVGHVGGKACPEDDGETRRPAGSGWPRQRDRHRVWPAPDGQPQVPQVATLLRWAKALNFDPTSSGG